MVRLVSVAQPADDQTSDAPTVLGADDWSVVTGHWSVVSGTSALSSVEPYSGSHVEAGDSPGAVILCAGAGRE